MSGSVSNLSLANALRLSVSRIQTNLSKAQTEVTTGRFADVGLELGSRTGQSISLRAEQATLTTITANNSNVTTRLSATNGALTSILGTAQSFMASLIQAQSAGTSGADLQSQAKAGLQALTAALNTSVNGQYVFGGLNTDQAPIADYDAAGSPAKAAVNTAFQAAFGVSQSDPNVSSISGSALQTFLDGSYSQLFDSTQWSSTWSSASDTVRSSQISATQTISTSVSANDPALRGLAKAFTMMADLGSANMSADAVATLTKTAAATVSTAITGLQTTIVGVGVAQNSVTEANDRMAVQIKTMSSGLDSLESVDPYEASTRLSSLKTQLETAFTLTSQLNDLSLVKYL